MTLEQDIKEAEKEFEEAFKEGFKKGFKEAHEQGCMAIKKYIAKKFLQYGLALDDVNKITDLSMEELQTSMRRVHYFMATNSISFPNNEYSYHLQ